MSHPLCGVAAATLVVVRVAACVLSAGGAIAVATVTPTPQLGSGGASFSQAETTSPTATPTCSCPVRCRCAEDQPYGVGLRQILPPLDAATLIGQGSRNSPARFGDPGRVATDQAPAVAEGECPQNLPSTPTPLPGAAWNLIQIGAEPAWRALGWPQTAMAQHKVYVAVVDTGVDTSHPDLSGRIAPWQISFAELQPSDDVSSDSAHGTAMSSIIAARGDNGEVGIHGIMWGTQVIPCKVGGGNNGTLPKALACLAWLEKLMDEQRVPIVAVNFSFGSDCCDCEMERAVARLRDRGVLFVASAGNGRKNADAAESCPFYPASYPLSNVVAVTGSDSYGNVLYRYGKRRVHVAAPGIAIPVLTPGGGRSVIPGGSSPAAAHATGLVALLYAQNPSRTWMQVRNLLLSSGPLVTCANQPICALVTGRRVQAWGADGHGALSCRQQIVVRRLLPVDDNIVARPGDTLDLRVLSINCAEPLALSDIEVQRASGFIGSVARLNFRDDGLPPDEVAGDGEFHARWAIAGPPNRDYVVTIGGESLRIHVVP
ncbi:MAG: S8 family serine peptidase [Candidatus Binatia bacterium]|nr:S8 family serine peptidase [Candidatus Binatia bacterium]